MRSRFVGRAMLIWALASGGCSEDSSVERDRDAPGDEPDASQPDGSDLDASSLDSGQQQVEIDGGDEPDASASDGGHKPDASASDDTDAGGDASEPPIDAGCLSACEAAQCGAVDDLCGGFLDCGPCESNCGSLCDAIPRGCEAASPTRLTGSVRTPGQLVSGWWLNQLAVPNALVYIPATPGRALPPIAEGVTPGDAASCLRCGSERLVEDGDSVLAQAVTDYKGEFVLSGRVPVGEAFELVVVSGKWRRVIEVSADTTAACETRVLGLEYTRLAAHSADGLAGTHLPKIAVSTGNADALECVLLGLGIDRSEFTVPSGRGRVHMYRANGARMRSCNGTFTQSGTTRQCAADNNWGCVNNRSGCTWTNVSVADAALYASQTAISGYDMVVFGCEGTGHYRRGTDPLSRVLTYVNSGGRVFASHWGYEWLDGNGELDAAAEWTAGSVTDGPGYAYVSLPSGSTARAGANPVRSELFRDWLDYAGTLTDSRVGELSWPEPPRFDISRPNDIVGASLGPSTDEWTFHSFCPDASCASAENQRLLPQQLSFNTPYGAADDAVCGRVAFSALHASGNQLTSELETRNLYFPAECSIRSLTTQEQTLAFMFLDLGACVAPREQGVPPEN